MSETEQGTTVPIAKLADAGDGFGHHSLLGGKDYYCNFAAKPESEDSECADRFRRDYEDRLAAAHAQLSAELLRDDPLPPVVVRRSWAQRWRDVFHWLFTAILLSALCVCVGMTVCKTLLGDADLFAWAIAALFFTDQIIRRVRDWYMPDDLEDDWYDY